MLGAAPGTSAAPGAYPWRDAAAARALEDALPPPQGFSRMALPPGSFGAWLRRLPLRSDAVVRDYRKRLVLGASSGQVAAVVDLGVGDRDLQQCADSIIRLHAEWLWSTGRRGDIAYSFTSGDRLSWMRWSQGERVKVKANEVRFFATGKPDSSRRAFDAYLETVFTYAGTRSLARDERAVPRAQAEPGDFFVEGGSPGHAVLLLDLAEDGKGGRRALIGQGFTPAQDFHVVALDGDPWISLDGDEVVTPRWRPFLWRSLRRFGPR